MPTPLGNTVSWEPEVVYVHPMRLSIVEPLFVESLGAITGAVIVSGLALRRHRLMKWVLRGFSVVLVVISAAAGVNAHYAYFPNLASLFGWRARDQISVEGFRRLAAMVAPHDVSARTGRRASPAAAAAVRPTARPAIARTLVHGVVVPFPIPGVVSGFSGRTAQVYVPPVWFARPGIRLPVIELLHGTPGSPADWTRGGGADVTADDYARLHGGLAPIIVMPDVNGSWASDTECVNGRHGLAETYLTVDVHRAVVAAFHTRIDAGGWAVAGLSEGGYCALELALRHPDMFSVVGDFSGGDHPTVSGGLHNLFDGSPAHVAATERQYNARVLLQTARTARPAIWMATGTDDGDIVRSMRVLMREAQARGLRTWLDLLDGGHTFRVWSKSFRNAMPWIAAQFTPPPLEARRHVPRPRAV